ncbi:glycosyltransferase family 1 protein [Pontibacter diazotrophicus]|uniref:Glycosyltransferase family 1 protein n=2 Tax=Pontibacter diazotrophicus TaxID=1400979 RepID=A0A3D8LHH9_9BACT|nr:glycosyltransferase family 1 protein [Pontibacter diazotrophicus]
MRIGIEAQRIFRPKKHGMEVVALELIRQLQESDKKNEYIIFAKEDTDIGCLKETENFKIETIPAYSYADWEQIQLPKAVKKSKIDFLHSTCNTSALWQSNPLLLTLHDIIYLEKVDFKGTAYQNFGNLYRRFVVPKVINKSTSIITVSHFERNTILEQLRLPEEKVQVVYNAVSDIFHSHYPVEQVEDFKSKHQIPEKFMLFLGNTAPKKNTKGVLSAYVEYCQCTKDPVPIVILDHDRSHVLAFLSEFNKKHLIPHFVFPGYVAPQQMPMMYNAAAVFLYPSLRESFGLPILEAMACGTPVITSTTSSMPEVAGGAALLVDPYKEKEIAEGIQKLLSDDNYYTDLVAKGLKRAADFTWKSSAKALLSIYDTFDN